MIPAKAPSPEDRSQGGESPGPQDLVHRLALRRFVDELVDEPDPLGIRLVDVLDPDA